MSLHQLDLDAYKMYKAAFDSQDERIREGLEQRKQQEKQLLRAQELSKQPIYAPAADIVRPSSTLDERALGLTQTMGRVASLGLGAGILHGYLPLVGAGLTGKSTLYHGTPVGNIYTNTHRAKNAIRDAMDYAVGAAAKDHNKDISELANHQRVRLNNSVDVGAISEVHGLLEDIGKKHGLAGHHIENMKDLYNKGLGIGEGGLSLAHAGKNFRLNAENLMNAAVREISERAGKELSVEDINKFRTVAHEAAAVGKPVSDAIIDHAMRVAKEHGVHQKHMDKLPAILNEYGRRIYFGSNPSSVLEWGGGENEMGMAIQKGLNALHSGEGDMLWKTVKKGLIEAGHLATGGLFHTLGDLWESREFNKQLKDVVDRGGHDVIERKDLASTIDKVVDKRKEQIFSRVADHAQHDAVRHDLFKSVSGGLRDEWLKGLKAADPTKRQAAVETFGTLLKGALGASAAKELEGALSTLQESSALGMASMMGGAVDAAGKGAKRIAGVMSLVNAVKGATTPEQIETAIRNLPMSEILESLPHLSKHGIPPEATAALAEHFPQTARMLQHSGDLTKKENVDALKQIYKEHKGGFQSILRVANEGGTGNMSAFVDFPVLGHLVGSYKPLQSYMRHILPNWSPGKDISIARSFGPETINRVMLADQMGGVHHVIDIKDAIQPGWKIPGLGNLKTAIKYAPMAALGTHFLSKSLTGKGLVEQLSSGYGAVKGLFHRAEKPSEKKASVDIEKTALSDAAKKALRYGAYGLGLGTLGAIPSILHHMAVRRADLSPAEEVGLDLALMPVRGIASALPLAAEAKNLRNVMKIDAAKQHVSQMRAHPEIAAFRQKVLSARPQEDDAGIFPRMIPGEYVTERDRLRDDIVNPHQTKMLVEKITLPVLSSAMAASVSPAIAEALHGQTETQARTVKAVGQDAIPATSVIPSEKVDRWMREHPELVAGANTALFTAGLAAAPVYIVNKHYKVTAPHIGKTLRDAVMAGFQANPGSKAGTEAFMHGLGGVAKSTLRSTLLPLGIAAAIGGLSPLVWRAIHPKHDAVKKNDESGSVGDPHPDKPKDNEKKSSVQWYHNELSGGSQVTGKDFLRMYQQGQTKTANWLEKETPEVLLELAGLGTLAIPSAYKLLHEPKEGDKDSAFHRLMQHPYTSPAMEVGGLGVLAAPYAYGVAKNLIKRLRG